MLRNYFIAILFFTANLHAQLNLLENRPLLFDIGTEESEVNEFSVKITESDLFINSNEYGWLEEYEPYINEELRLKTVRDELTYDGIQSKKISFQINLPKGEYYFTFWTEVGLEDISTTELKIDDKIISVVWHELKESAEGRLNRSKNYRVVHTKVFSDGNRLNFSLKNNNHKIQLSAFSFCPQPSNNNDIHKKLFRTIKEAGKYKSQVILSDLELSLKNYLRSDLTDPFLFYWHQQVSLLAEAERYLNTRGWEWARHLMGQSIFDRMHQVLLLTDALLENTDISNSPLLERALWIRGKLSYDLVLERGGEYQRKIYKDDLNNLLMHYPEDETLVMLNGGKIDQKDYCDNLSIISNAPEWSLLQREALCRLKNEIYWWVNNRQAPNGELGGKIGDDVEILREWKSLLFLGDSTTIKGWKKITNAVLSDPKVYKGFSKKILDVEHSSEFISDEPPELILLENSEHYSTVMKYTAEYFENLWTYKNEHGRRYFKSAWYSSTAVDERPPRNRDLGYNTRTVKPLRFLAWKTRDPEYIQLLEEWTKGWLFAAMKTDNGKPKGIIPAAVRYYDESINADGSTWYDPDMYWEYFKWQHDAGSKILDQLLFTYALTSKLEYIEPIKLYLELLNKYEAESNSLIGSSVGSEKWIAYYISKSKNFWSVVERWRIISRNSEYDELIIKYGTPYIRYLLTNNSTHLSEGLIELLNTLRYNIPLRTNLVLHTDRVRIPGTEILQAMITGDGGIGNSPYYEVTWLNAADDLTILVNKSDSLYLEIDLFSFSDETIYPFVRPWSLTSGDYDLIIKGKSFHEKTMVRIENIGQIIRLNIPSKELTKVKFIKK